ncbi:FadR/GntR family transcriptional regulator [Clostridium sp.]|uniref:FadR/GntR family transcriptional regulator n=1 Tax=Clostridium sp. TaxID=1506 RepID=UPI001A59D6E0|nr:FadR/GntR family transcriptional regulator [Clostridium sp.]MBK5243098.1 FadR family transcriptional regulator [Clostridium sp.]
MAIKPIKQNNISNQVFEQIKAEIASGEWPPGSRIPSENEFVKMLNVSRITVRNALQRLIALELLEIRQGDGTFVRGFSADMYMNSLMPMLFLEKTEILEVLEFRKVIEIETGALTVERATEEDIKKLEAIYEKMEKYIDNAERFATEDLNFHMALAETTKNSLVIKVNYIIKDILSASMSAIVRNLGVDDGLYYHKLIIEAIKERDMEKVKRTLKDHIVTTIDKVSKIDSKLKDIEVI